MSPLSEVLDAVEGRVGYLRAATAVVPGEDGWVRCDAVTPAVLDASLAGSKAADDPVVALSLLQQSHAFKVAAITLAAYAVGLPWPDPDPAHMAVRLAAGRATGVAYLGDTMGAPGDVGGLVAALRRHLEPVAEAARGVAHLGRRLLVANAAASAAAALRSVEGAARDRGDGAERTAVRSAGEAWVEVHGRGAGWFETAGDDWLWRRTGCCLWYRSSGGRTCDDCSLTRRSS